MTDEFSGALKLRTSQPEVPPQFLDRPRLNSIFARGAARSVTIVCAGAGYGKTLAITAWIRQGDVPGPIAWLTSDHDYNVRGFWTDLLVALRIANVLPATGPLRDIAPGPRFGVPELERIVEALTQLPDPVVVVLDDFQNVQDDQVLDFLSRVAERRIPQLRLILVTRTEPRLRLSRLRLADQVIDIGANDLAFTAGETREVCKLSGAHPADRDLTFLMQRTQGWPAGVRLALLNLNDPTAEDVGLGNFGGNNRRVAEYLLEEVLDQLSPNDRRFLLSTSAVDEMTAELARCLTGRADSQQVLENLVARNALTIRLSDRPDWFRYHPLLRELLRDRLAAENPDSIAELNRLAAQWYAFENEPIFAIKHYSLAHDWTSVLRVLGSSALPMILSPRASALVAALAPADAEASQRPTVPSLLAAMVCAYQRHDFESMARHTEDAAELLDDAANPEPAAAILITVARMVHARTSTPGAIVDTATRLLDLANNTPRQQVPAAGAYALIASNNRAIGLVLEGHFDEARIGLIAAQVSAQHLGMGILEMAAAAYLSLVDAMVGNLTSARRLSSKVTDIAERRGWVNEPQRLAAVAATVLVHLQSNELDLAQKHIDEALSSNLPETDIGARLIINIASVGVAIARRDVDEARLRLKLLDREHHGAATMTGLLTRWIDTTHADVFVLCGDPADALALIDDPGEADDYASALQRITRGRAFLALADPAGAVTALGPSRQFSDFRVQATEAAILESIACRRLHRDVESMARFARAVELAKPVRLVGPFVTAGPQIATQVTRHEHLTDDYSEFVATLSLPKGTSPMDIEAPSAVPQALTEREQAVLQYLPTVLRATDIADDLFVSVNTVKTHMRGIYSKLGVSSRREAVQRARFHELL